MDTMVNSCKKTTELIDKGLLTTLTIKEKMQLSIHTSMCKTCKSYEHQAKFIDKAISKLFNSTSKINTDSSVDRKRKIIEKINKS
ncbi:hypothetical protein EV196_107286 [Mariniflexile fucanivorans]|uniref:Uncharacterized protein n=1 Tax=Mariniflexile fucanivorans TaxID=264023 RepID=A0A4R1RF64_9FLAO|nr:hypothetical protein EV196_107286 [Mariniflexile fucanivorans]